MTATQNTVTIGEGEGAVTVGEHQDTFSFTVPGVDKVKPEYAELAGTKLENLPFTFPQASSDDEAAAIAKAKGWTLTDFVNDTLKANAKSSAYQAQLAKYKLEEVDREKVIDRMVRDFIKLGFAEDVARNMVNAALANK